MSKITKQDTNGVKPLLSTGELGYDNYPAGGDDGRLYVGTGTENIPLAKKTEVTAVDTKADTHIGRVDNPHSVTKVQVGLGNVDNTADADKNVLSASKLTTARTIGGVSFDGSTNINLPGVNTAGNQNTTGNAATATKLATARTIALSGDVTGNVNFDGSANVSITTTVADDSHNHVISNVYGLQDALDSKANQSNTYTKTEVNNKYSGFKNYIINGKKVVNQRALTSTDNSYNQDRWYKVGNNWFQGIEGDNNLISGKKYTLSWVGDATASYYVGTATSSTINAQSFTAITNGGNFTLTISAGQNLWVKFASDSTGSTFNYVQLEEGTIATPFENRPIGLELSLCQRYYEVVNVTDQPQAAVFYNNYRYLPIVSFVLKRVMPTISLLIIYVYPGGGNTDTANYIFNVTNTKVGLVDKLASGTLYTYSIYINAEL